MEEVLASQEIISDLQLQQASKKRKLTDEELSEAKQVAEKLKGVEGITNPHAFGRWVVQHHGKKWKKYVDTMLKKRSKNKKKKIASEYGLEFTNWLDHTYHVDQLTDEDVEKLFEYRLENYKPVQSDANYLKQFHTAPTEGDYHPMTKNKVDVAPGPSPRKKYEGTHEDVKKIDVSDRDEKIEKSHSIRKYWEGYAPNDKEPQKPSYKLPPVAPPYDVRKRYDSYDKKVFAQMTMVREKSRQFPHGRSDSYWELYNGDVVFKVSAREALTDNKGNVKVIENFDKFATEAYGFELIEEYLKRNNSVKKLKAFMKCGKVLVAEDEANDVDNETDEEVEDQDLRPDEDIEEEIEEKGKEKEQPQISDLLIDYLSDLVVGDDFNLSDVVNQFEAEILSKDNWEAFKGALSQAVDNKTKEKEEAGDGEGEGEVEQEKEIMKYKDVEEPEETSEMNDVMQKPYMGTSMQAMKKATEKAINALIKESTNGNGKSLDEVIALFKELGLDPTYLAELRKAMLLNLQAKNELTAMYKAKRARKLISEMELKGLVDIDPVKKRELEQSLMKLDDEQFMNQVRIISKYKAREPEKEEDKIQRSGMERVASMLKDGPAPIVMQSETKIAQTEVEELASYLNFEKAPNWEEVKKHAYDKVERKR